MMKDARFVIPPALARIVSRLPQTPPAAVLAFALDRLLFPLLPLADLEALLEQPLRIEVSDLGLRLALTLTRQGFRPLPLYVAPRLTLRATARDYLALLRREEDADTLFFQRRLVLSGDTELGLLVKNTLDAIELEVPFLPHLH
ncbi:MAG: SCP2 sterol-binding domain-containing protein [Tepidiphilus sp.]|nr:SCP2 sterol-binding domain-containing protein [Tepidiphilus sp.]